MEDSYTICMVKIKRLFLNDKKKKSEMSVFVNDLNIKI